MNGLSEKQLVFILASLSALTPLAIDMYLPAIKGMETIFNATNEQISTSVSIFFLGMAFGQLFGGPISDAYGRYYVIIVGLLFFSTTSILTIFTTDVSVLCLFRFLQAFGGGVVTVNIAASVRDYFSGKDSARILSLIGSVSILAPLVAPALGLGILVIFDDYRVIFVFLFLYAIASLLFYIKYFKSQKNIIKKTKITPIKNYLEVLLNKKTMLMIFAFVVSCSGNYCIISSSSFIYTTYFKLTSFWYVICFSLNIIVLLAVIRINIRLVKFRSPAKLLFFGLTMQLCFGTILFFMHESASVYVITPLIALYVGVQGFIFGNGVSVILDNFPKISASANAIIGSLQYGIGSASGLLANYFSDGTLFPVALLLLAASFFGLLFFLFSLQKSRA